MRFTEWDQDTVGGSNKTPEEKYHHKCAQGTVIRRLCSLVHEQVVVLVEF
jgi:hypothetical protein